MRYTFNLKKPNKEGQSLIFLKAYFKNEARKFVYSTNEFIKPEDWDYENKQPNNLNGKTPEAQVQRDIKAQLERYGAFFNDTVTHNKKAKKENTIDGFKADFDKEFKRTTSVSSGFFNVYDLFITYKKQDYTKGANATSTIKRYEYNKTMLLAFETYRKKKINFNQIDLDFYNSLLEFFIEEKKQGANTIRRNVGLFKTFLYWSESKGHTYKTDFHEFIAPTADETDEVALTIEQIQEVFDHDFSKNPRLERVRDLFVFGCSTGMRISNYSQVTKKDIENGSIKVRDAKNNQKTLRIPLTETSMYVLKKYDFNLPNISTQKFNKYIKEVFKAIGYDWEVTKTSRIGNKVIEKISPFYDRISSHTARRSFITVMKDKKIPDKVIMSITGHKSFEVFNKYYKPSDKRKSEFMHTVWNLKKTPLKKVN